MKITKQDVLSYVVPAIIGIIIGLCLVKCASKPVDNIKIESDTVIVTDTIPQYYPKFVEVVKTKVDYKYLTRVETNTDTLLMRDSVLVEVPIESKHYHANEYDAWVSGYEPSLDSIKVYQRTEYITERVTVSKPPNRFTIGVQGGYGYGFKSKQWEPYVGLGIGIRIF